MTIPSIIMAALYAYTPIDAEKGVTIVKLFTYDATVGILIMFLGSALAFMIMKWRAKSIWDSSSLPKSGIAGIPWMSIIAAIYSAFLVLQPLPVRLGRPLRRRLQRTSPSSSWPSCTWPRSSIWIIAWATRKRQGMALEAVAKEIPVE